MIPCYDMVPGDVGRALIRHFLLRPVGPRLSSSQRVADVHVTCQPLSNKGIGDWKAYFSGKRDQNLRKLIDPKGYLTKLPTVLKVFPESSKKTF